VFSPYTPKHHRSIKASNEVRALLQLNERGCEHVPSLLGFFRHFSPGEPSILRSEEFLIMTKLPGVTLQDTYRFMEPSEQEQVKEAFIVALQAVHDCDVDNGSHHLGNVLWCREENKW